VPSPFTSLRACFNRRLRASLLGIADNWLQCNDYFRGLAGRWKACGKDPRHSHVKVACRFSRLAYLIVAGGELVPHPCLLPRSAILDKLIEFHQQHQTPPDRMLAELQTAADRLPRGQYAHEAVPLVKRLAEARIARRRGPQPIGEILPLLLAKLGIGDVPSMVAGVRDLS